MIRSAAGLRRRRARRAVFWLAWFVAGWLTGIVTLLVLAGMSARLAPTGLPPAADSDIRLQINIGYFNDVVRRRLAQSPPVIVANITATDLQVGLLPGAGLVLTPTFDVAGFFKVSPSASNQLTVRDGKLALNMIGQPRLGALQIPLDLLPFDLAGETRQAVDQITNTILLAELNDDLKAGFGSDTFAVTSVQTAGDYLAITLQRR